VRHFYAMNEKEGLPVKTLEPIFLGTDT